MDTVEALQKQIADLRSLRSQAINKVVIGDEETWFKTDAEMANAIADLERRLIGITSGRVTTVRFSTSKGL